MILLRDRDRIGSHRGTRGLIADANGNFVRHDLFRRGGRGKARCLRSPRPPAATPNNNHRSAGQVIFIREVLDVIRKFLFVTSTLLLPYLAYAADPSAPLSVQVVPAGSSPMAPTGAQAAGFTTLALNSDFTQQLPSNWLGGCAVAGSGAPTNLNDNSTGHSWWMNLWWMYGYQPCTVAQRIDPAFGGLVLDMPWVVDSANFNQGRGVAVETASWTYDPNATPVVGQAVTFPLNAYFEIVARQTPILPASFFAFNTWTPDAIANQNLAGVEIDIIELDTGNLGDSEAGAHNFNTALPHPGQFLWVGKGSPGLPTDFDPNQYHKFGMLTTSDGTTLELCSYIDNVFQKCISMSGGLTAQEENQRQFLILQSFCDSWNYNNSCNGNDGITQHLYVKSVRVWSCATWQSTQCNGTGLKGFTIFAGTPGKANCYGATVSALAKKYRGLDAAAAALGYPSVAALQDAILAFCGDRYRGG